MKKAPIPNDEAKRLEELYSCDILDTEKEAAFDEVVQLAARVCKTSGALISLTDRYRQWFKSTLNFEAVEAPRDISFCGHAILSDEVFIVPDTHENPDFSDNPYVKNRPYIRFYMGAPLITESGHKIGTLCVIDPRPSTPSEDQIQCLKLLAKQVVLLIQTRRSNKELQQKIDIINQQQATLIESSKMASLGLMAGGIAHEINNPLTIISGYADALTRRPERACEYAEKINKSVYRVSEIVKGLRSFSREDKGEYRKTALNNIVNDTLALCMEKFRFHEVDVRCIFHNSPDVYWAPVQISQVLLNLLNNAFDVVSDSSEERDKWIQIDVRQKNKNIIIEVQNSGKKISKEVANQAFDPFFTTKEVGRGTGLGLSIAKGLVEAHQGTINIESEGPYTCFKIEIPIQPLESPQSLL